MVQEKQNIIRLISQTVAIVAFVFIIIISSALVFNYIRLKSATPVNSVTEQLIKKLDQNPDDQELKQQIRKLDLVSRKTFFSTYTQLKYGAYFLFAALLIFLISVKITKTYSKKLPVLSQSNKKDFWEEKKKERFWILFTAGTISGIAILLFVFSISEYSDFNSDAKQKITSVNENQKEQAKDSVKPNSVQGKDTSITATEKDSVPSETNIAPPDSKSILANWPGFRGPFGLGISYHKNIPTNWNGKEGKNIKWKISLPLPGYNSPVIWGDYLFLTGANANKREIYCINRHSGKFIWTKQADNIPGSPASSPKVTDDTGLAAPSVATDGKQIYAIFGNGDLICLDFTGKKVWSKNMGVPSNHYGHSSSLIIYSSILIIQYDNNKTRNLYGLDINNGEVKWNTARPGKISWSSPSIVKTGNSYQIIVNNEPFVAGYNPENGKELWKVDCLSGEIGPSPAYSDGIVFAVNEYAKLAAIKPGNPPKILWENNDYLSEVSSPVAYKEFLIIPTSGGEVACYNTKDGTLFWQHEFNIGFYSSPIIAEGNIYLIDRDGIMHIIKLDKTFTLISEPALGDKTDCTPAFANGKIYIRGKNNLYCISEK